MKPTGKGLGLPALVLALILSVLAAGCQDVYRRQVAGGTTERAIAVVNNERITLEEFLNAHLLVFTRWDRFIAKDREKKQEIKEIVLANMIDQMLLDQEARRRGIEAKGNVLEQEMQKLIAPYSEEDLLRTVRRADFSMDQWRKQFSRRVSHEALIRQEVIGKIRVTQRELRAHFERNKGEFVIPEQVRVRHIAVGSRSQFRKLVRRLRQGRDFIKLVRAYSITPDRDADGDLGYVGRGVLPQAIDQAIFRLTSIGSITPTDKPVRTQIGYHVFRLEGRKPRSQLSYRQALPQVRKSLVDRKQFRAYQQWIQGLRDRATIKIDRTLLTTDMG